MNYVFDNSPSSALFRNFYRKTFRTLWERFDALVADSSIVSTREALREIKDGGPESLLEWVEQHQASFATPTAEEGRFERDLPCTAFSAEHRAAEALKGREER